MHAKFHKDLLRYSKVDVRCHYWTERKLEILGAHRREIEYKGAEFEHFAQKSVRNLTRGLGLEFGSLHFEIFHKRAFL
jgi:hypothetical protein